MRLLVNGGDWGTVSYVSELKRDTHIDWFFKGYKDHPDGDGSMVWDYSLARASAGIERKRKFGSLKKKASNNKKRKVR